MAVDTISYFIARCDICRSTLNDPDTFAPALYNQPGPASDAALRDGWTVAKGHMVCPAKNTAHAMARNAAKA